MYATPNECFEHVNIDIGGPLPPSGNYSYILTMIDRFSRSPEATPMTDQTAETVAKTFMSTWIARFGCPQRISTDRGRQFESSLFNQLTMTVGCQHLRTKSYHPQSNGMVERWHRTLKSAIICRQNQSWAMGGRITDRYAWPTNSTQRRHQRVAGRNVVWPNASTTR